MPQAPDLSKIVSIIMENPALISQISELAKSSQTQDEVEKAPEPEEEAVTAKETVITQEKPAPHAKAHRKELLNAMKPYLSETRRGALDSMATILDIIDVMLKKES